MKQEIINKYNLQPTNKTIGDSFIMGIIIYQFSNELWCMKMDMNGKPLKETETICFFNKKGHVVVSEMFLLDIDENLVRKAINENLSSLHAKFN